MKKLLLTTASAGLIAMAGPALAQTGGAAPGTGSPGMESERTSPGTTGAQQRQGTGPAYQGSAEQPLTSPDATGAQQRSQPGTTTGAQQHQGTGPAYQGSAEQPLTSPDATGAQQRSQPGTTGAQQHQGTGPAYQGSAEKPLTSPGPIGAQQREGAQQRGHPGAVGTMQDAAPPANVLGRTLRGSEGDNIGEIEAVEGNNLIVSVGGFLGIGARDVAIPWSQVTMMGSGEDAELQTSLTKDQLKEMPEYKRERGTGATGTAPRGGATGGGAAR